MKYKIAILTLLFISSCVNNNGNKSRQASETIQIHEETNDQSWNYKEVGQTYIDQLMQDPCSSQELEFVDLYPTLDSIASDRYEKLVLVESLKAKGFEVTKWGRGNWQEGPRVVSLTLSNGQCDCQVDKLYYSTKEEGKYKVTEAIKCKKINK